MSYAILNAPNYRSLFAVLSDRFTKWQSYRRARGELSMMDDRQLDDLGIGRGDIEAVARGTYVDRR